ncbi:MAG: hypothetical protein GY952_06740 [Rhodobacteraceae bacterium]|nr:hypothetical protein [Paracoccaceae bacterium]
MMAELKAFRPSPTQRVSGMLSDAMRALGHSNPNRIRREAEIALGLTAVAPLADTLERYRQTGQLPGAVDTALHALDFAGPIGKAVGMAALPAAKVVRRAVYRVVPGNVPANEAFRPADARRGVYAFGDEASAREFQKHSGGKIVKANIDNFTPEYVDDFSIELFPQGNSPVTANLGDTGLYPKGSQFYIRDTNLIDPTTAKDIKGKK